MGQAVQDLKLFCEEHPGVRAIGVCVITGKAICSECSTQYKGVNYSKEGLEILLADERKVNESGRLSSVLLMAIMLLTLPLAILLLFATVHMGGQAMVDLSQFLRDRAMD